MVLYNLSNTVLNLIVLVEFAYNLLPQRLSFAYSDNGFEYIIYNLRGFTYNQGNPSLFQWSNQLIRYHESLTAIYILHF